LQFGDLFVNGSMIGLAALGVIPRLVSGLQINKERPGLGCSLYSKQFVDFPQNHG
jgi:hypothetical protein